MSEVISIITLEQAEYLERLKDVFPRTTFSTGDASDVFHLKNGREIVWFFTENYAEVYSMDAEGAYTTLQDKGHIDAVVSRIIEGAKQ